MQTPFVLLDDARDEGGRDARLYRAPHKVVVARRPEHVAPALARIEALAQSGAELAGYIAYEAGLALEPKLAPLAPRRTGGTGPLVWIGAFAGSEAMRTSELAEFLSGDQPGSDRIALGPLEPQLSIGGYARTFTALREAIEAGDVYQANLTFQLSGSWHGDPLAIYRAIRPHAAGGYGGVVFDGSDWLLSFSPELFFTLRDSVVTSRPMKGTRARVADPIRDCAASAELAASVKDRAENLMIVDLMRNDLARVAEPGSVRVEAPFAVETYPTVHQMTTTVRAKLSSKRSTLDLVRATFPCGSITGAPKLRAMELIDLAERDARGAYCGAIGRIAGGSADGAGDAAFNVAIRTLRLVPEDGGRRGRAVMGVGSAVVADSQALGEWRECVVKGGFVSRSAAAAFDLIETMRFDPGAGIARLELHLARMEASAAELGFTFDRDAMRNAVQRLCLHLDRPSRVRAVLARSGARAIEVMPLPPPLRTPARVALLALPVGADDWRLRHKTSDRGFYEAGLQVARAAGADEAVFVDAEGRITEGSFTNVFVERDGQLLTPGATVGLLAGVLRRALLDERRAVEADVPMEDLARDFLIGNAVRGLLPAQVLGG